MSNPIDPDAAAFPSGSKSYTNRDGDVCQEAVNEGMTQRTWLIGKALQGLLANPLSMPAINQPHLAECARAAVQAADFAIQADKKSRKPSYEDNDD